MANIDQGIEHAKSRALVRMDTNDPTAERKPSLSVEQLRKQYLDYLHSKTQEIREQREARHYYHGDQWTSEEIAVLRARKQPVITKNRTARKINAVVGMIERMRQDPKAYPRTPQHEQGAEVATAVIRYVLDNNRWETLSNDCGLNGAVDGIGGLELIITRKEQGDPDVELAVVDGDLFFYDPRSFREDFSDARYMGVSKWVDEETAKELLPEDKHEDISHLVGGGGSELGADSDRERRWVDSDNKRLRLVDHWYKHNGEWHWCVYSWDTVFMEGKSPHIDENGDTMPKYVMYSATVDHDGDRYGFIRNMKSMQDEINHRGSKALHYLNTRGVILEEGAVDDVEALRKEMARPDRVIVKQPGLLLEFDDQRQLADMAGQVKFLEMAVQEFENFGPNPALVGEGGVENSSGRAISLLQQAGIQELGPFMIGFRGWKLRVYRAVWNSVQRFWTAERFIRVTDDEGVAQFVKLNGVDVDPNTGMPATVNAVGSLDVDIILDEGPDTLTMEADTFASLQALGPGFAERFPEIALDLMPGVQPSVKKKMREKMQQQSQQPNPDMMKAQQDFQLAQQKAQSDLQITQAKAMTDIQAQREKNAATMQLKYTEAQAELEIAEQRAQQELAIERARAGITIAAEKEKHEMNMVNEQQKAAMTMDNERQKADIGRQVEADKHGMGLEAKRAQMEMDFEAGEGERQAKSKQAETDAKKADRLDEVLATLTRLVEQSMKPRTVVRDVNGRVAGIR